jgi:hypothetical protein
MNHAAQHLGVANVSPKSILDMNYAFAQTALLMAAVRLYLFTYLASDPLPAMLVKTEPEPVTRLLEGLCTLLSYGREPVMLQRSSQSCTRCG